MLPQPQLVMCQPGATAACSSPSQHYIMNLSAPHGTKLLHGMVHLYQPFLRGEQARSGSLSYWWWKHKPKKKQIFARQGVSRGNAPFPLLEFINIKQGEEGKGGLRTSLKSCGCPSCEHHQRDPHQGGPWRCSAKQCKNQKKKPQNIFMA